VPAADPVVGDAAWKASLSVVDREVNGKIEPSWVSGEPSDAGMTVLIKSNNQANRRTTMQLLVMPLCDDKIADLHLLPFDPH